MEKIKQFLISEKGKNIFVVTIIILVGTGSFQLGRLSQGNKSSGIKIEYPNTITSLPPSQTPTQVSIPLITNTSTSTSTTSAPVNKIVKNFFASNRGSKYYPVSCSAGKTIIMENRVYFETREQAVAAGYELSSSCK